MVRGLLTDDERHLLFAIPADQETLIQHYTLAPDEIELTLGKRGARNRLGLALQLCLLRHPGFGFSAAENVPDELLRYLGAQLGVPASVYLDYSRRSQTRSDHGQELAGMLGLHMPGRGDIPLMIGLAAAAARETDRGVPIVAELMAQLRTSGEDVSTDDTLIAPGPDQEDASTERIGTPNISTTAPTADTQENIGDQYADIAAIFFGAMVLVLVISPWVVPHFVSPIKTQVIYLMSSAIFGIVFAVSEKEGGWAAFILVYVLYCGTSSRTDFRGYLGGFLLNSDNIRCRH
jgi:hypothetical protein